MPNIRHSEGDSPRPADSYRTIEDACEAEVKVLGSRFIGLARGVAHEAAFMDFLHDIRRQHHSATHHCYAYRFGIDGAPFKYSDDGEPSGTAGIRIHGAIEKAGLSDVGVIVVRYFGGTKLGMGGLAHAYSDAADAVLAVATPVERILYDHFIVRFPYDLTSQVHHVLERCGAEIHERVYQEDVRYIARIRRSQSGALDVMLPEYTNKAVTIEYRPSP